MKIIQLLVLAFATFGFVSCTVSPGGYADGGYGEGDGYSRGPQQQQPWGLETRYRQKYLTEEKIHAQIRVQGAAPSAVCLQVRDDIGAWATKIHGEHGTWPTRQEATAYAKKAFARRGYNLQPTESMGRPGGFKVTEWVHTQTVGERVKTGEPEKMGTREVFQEDVPQSILERSRKGGYDEGQREEGDYNPRLLKPIEYSVEI